MPAAKDDIKAEQVYNALAQSLKAPITEKRIWNPHAISGRVFWRLPMLQGSSRLHRRNYAREC
ncbi:MAG: hypothetical protein V7K72_00790, partial [Nostoc sp.]